MIDVHKSRLESVYFSHVRVYCQCCGARLTDAEVDASSSCTMCLRLKARTAEMLELASRRARTNGVSIVGAGDEDDDADPVRFSAMEVAAMSAVIVIVASVCAITAYGLWNIAW